MSKKDVVPLGIKGFNKFVEGIPPGSCILLLSPPMVEARLFTLEFVYSGLKEKIPALIIELDDSPEKLRLKALRYKWPLIKYESEDLLKWVDGYSTRSDKDIKDTRAVKRVSGPLALSDMSIALTGAQIIFKSKSDTYKMVFDSISTILLYNQPTTVYRFLQVITAKIKNSEGVGLFVLGQGMHDSKVEMTIRHLMDGAIQLNEDMSFKIISFPIRPLKKKGSLNLKSEGFEAV
jgi:KaiC/GvpD/RAD55 family RecA-like ATPase